MGRRGGVGRKWRCGAVAVLLASSVIVLGASAAGAAGAPRALAWTTTSRAVTVDWGSTAVGATYRATASSGRMCAARWPAHSCTITGLRNGSTQRVTVASTAAPSAILAAADVSVGVPMPPSSVIASAAPIIAGQAAPSAGSVQVSWVASTIAPASPVTGYLVTASPGGATCSVTFASGATTQPAACTIAGLSPGGWYTFTVQARNVNGYGPASAPSQTYNVSNAPSAPTGLVATASGTDVTARWSAPVSTGGQPVLAYEVTATPSNALTGTSIVSPCLVSAPTTSCTLTGFAPGTNYTVSVRAINAAGPGPTVFRTVAVNAVAAVFTGRTPTGSPGAYATFRWAVHVDGTVTSLSYYPSTAALTRESFGSVSSIVRGIGHTCALMTDGTVKCIGDNSQGQVGSGAIGSAAASWTSVPNLYAVKSLAASGNTTCAVGYYGGPAGAATTSSPSGVVCWGANTNSLLGYSSPAQSVVPLNVPRPIGIGSAMSVTMGEGFACASTLSPSQLMCWGDNSYGQFGTGSAGATSNLPTAVALPLNGVAEIESGIGRRSLCVRYVSGIVQCAGRDSWGELGLGTTVAGSFPRTVPTFTTVPGLSNVVGMALGTYTSCFLTASGSVRCAGYNFYGSLGTNSTLSSLSTVGDPVIGATGVVRVDAAGDQFFAVLADGSVRTWGGGELGGGGMFSAVPYVTSG